jgi:hypothetical protein
MAPLPTKPCAFSPTAWHESGQRHCRLCKNALFPIPPVLLFASRGFISSISRADRRS